MTGSLRKRWTLVLVGVCVLQALLVAVAVRVSTNRAFERFVIEEALAAFVLDVEAVAQRSGTVTTESLASIRAPGEPRAEPVDPTRPRRRLPPPARLGRRISFGLADAQGRVVRAFDGYAQGEALAPALLESGSAVVVGGQRVATAFVPVDAKDALDGMPSASPEARFVASSTAALAVALALALAVALGVGVWLAGRTVGPLGRLTEAARAIADGELGQSVEVTSDDEVGALAQAFNTMSARLAQATVLRRQMTADVSHDLRTPVTAVLGTLELIESGALAPTPERIRTARQQAERLARLIESFHTLALADAGELPMRPARLALTMRCASRPPRSRCAPTHPVSGSPSNRETRLMSGPTPTGWPRCSTTSSATRFGTRRWAGRSRFRPSQRRAASLSRSRTRAKASRPTYCPTYSSGPCAPMGRGREEAPDWA